MIKTVVATMLTLAAMTAAVVAPGSAEALPDNRAYELVSRYEQGGREVGLNGIEVGVAIPSANGDAADWESIGACCDAQSGSLNLYRSLREPNGWQTHAVTPAPSEPMVGLFEEVAPVLWTSDLAKTIFSTPSTYAPGDQRPKGSRAHDLYLEDESGAMQWLSQGPISGGTAPVTAEFDGATPDVGKVVFSSAEQLTANATGMEPLNTPGQYLYMRDLGDQTTTLLDVDSKGELLGRYGASLGNGGWLKEDIIPVNYDGTTTNAVSSDGMKVYFQTPNEEASDLPPGTEPHLYLRDLASQITTPLDNPESNGYAQYEGAASNGSLAFFTSNEGLDGTSPIKELYEFNSTATTIGAAAPMGSAPIAGGHGVEGITAVSNDGSRVFFVSKAVLASSGNSVGGSPVADQPNLYIYETSSRDTRFVATLSPLDIGRCEPTCAMKAHPEGLIGEPDVSRLAFPTPDGNVFAFDSAADVTGQASDPTTILQSEALAGGHKLVVASTAGFIAGRPIAIGSGGSEELQRLEAVDGPNELTISEYTPGGENGLVGAHLTGEQVTQPTVQAYRYDVAEGALDCLSCPGPGTIVEGSAIFGFSGGGSYAPPRQTVPMSENGGRIFFETTERLLPEAGGSPMAPIESVYEWEDGHLSLISDGVGSAFLGGVSRNGSDAFITTHDELDAAGFTGRTNGPLNIYDARENGGFPLSPPAPPPCSGEDCRPSTGSTIFFSTPASATLGGEQMRPPATTPTFTVATITDAQRNRLIRTGVLTLRVSTAARGILEAAAIAMLGHVSRRVAHARVTLARAGVAQLTLRLSRTTLAALRRKGKLELRLEVSYGTSRAVKVATLALRTGTRHA